MEATSTVFMLCLHWELSSILVKVTIIRYNRPTIWTARSVTNVRVHLLTTDGLRTLLRNLEIAWISGCHLTIYLRHIFELIVDGAVPECDIPCLKKESRSKKYCKNAWFEDHFILSPCSSCFVSLIQLNICSKRHTIACPARIWSVVQEKIIGA